MECTQHRHYSLKPKKRNQSTIQIHTKVHSAPNTSEINYNRWINNHSEISDQHSFVAKQVPILRVPTKDIEQSDQIIENNNQKRKHKRRRCLIYGLFCILYCLFLVIGLVALIIALMTKSTVTTTTIANVLRFSRFNINMIINGDAEAGPCEMNKNVTSPTDWNFNGSITQTSYNNTVYPYQKPTTPGPSDRGNCYFSGHISKGTTMWQTIDLNNYVDPVLIDTQTVRFNLSAWIGGYDVQDDNAVVSLFFYNQFNQTIGNETKIGPVLAVDRANQTSLLFRQINGLVPIDTRFFKILVALSFVLGSYNNGCVDNISITLYS